MFVHRTMYLSRMKILSILLLASVLSPAFVSAVDSFSSYPICKKLPLQTSADVIANLSSFSTFYVKFGNCAYSIQTTGDGNGNGGGDEGWYQGFTYTRGANVAYSLYGSKSGFGGCSQSTFINSFYTLDGLYSFTDSTGISLSNLYTYSYYDGEEGENNDNKGGYCSSALTCGDAKNNVNSFIQAKFSGGACVPSSYLSTTDSLWELNLALDKQRCVEISSDTALNLLTYSQTCTALSGSQCPDPHGFLADCEQKYKEFDAIVLSGGRDPNKRARFLYGCLLFVLAFLIYGFALQKKEKTKNKSVDETKFIDPGTSTQKEFIDPDASKQNESTVEPVDSSPPAHPIHPVVSFARPASIQAIPIQHVALSFARTVSNVARSVSNVVKEVVLDDDEDDAVPYVPLNTSQDYVSETSTTDSKSKKKKQGLRTKLKKLMKRK